MREGNRLCVDARSGLELPYRFAGFRIDRDELSGFFPCEEQSATGGYDSRPVWMVHQWRAPASFAGHRVDGVDMPDGFSGNLRHDLVFHKLIACSGSVRLKRHEMIKTCHMLRIGIEQPGFRIERGVRPVFSAASRWPQLDFLSCQQLLRYI